MSGRVLIDGEAAGDPLLYASNRPDSAWHRFGMSFADGGSLYLRDPRRSGRGGARSRRRPPRPRRVRPDAAAAPCDRHPEPRADQGRAHGPVAHRRPREPAVRRSAVACGHRPRASPPTPSTTPTPGACTGRSATPCASSAAGAGRTPATSPRSVSPARTARGTARRSFAGPSAAAPPTRAPCTRSERTASASRQTPETFA